MRKKRAEIAGQIAAHERDIGQLRADLRHIDAVLRVYGFDNPELIPNKRAVKPKTLWFRGGECARLALDTLRAGGGQLSTRAITGGVMKAKDLDPADTRTRELVQKAVLGSLGRMKGVVERSGGGGPGCDVFWRLADH
ncbi:MAG: hypothetical protein H7Y60_10295 [Rhodospirillaceae bacterium]|nr:hypothetical protein [Rhodospirillales bacterium]